MHVSQNQSFIIHITIPFYSGDNHNAPVHTNCTHSNLSRRRFSKNKPLKCVRSLFTVCEAHSFTHSLIHSRAHKTAYLRTKRLYTTDTINHKRKKTMCFACLSTLDDAPRPKTTPHKLLLPTSVEVLNRRHHHITIPLSSHQPKNAFLLRRRGRVTHASNPKPKPKPKKHQEETHKPQPRGIIICCCRLMQHWRQYHWA